MCLHVAYSSIVYILSGKVECPFTKSVISQLFWKAIFSPLENCFNHVHKTITSGQQSWENCIFHLSSSILSVWISNIVKMGLCFFLLSFSLQAFIETMFASKAPVEEGFLYAKVSFKCQAKFCRRQMYFLDLHMASSWLSWT